MNGGLISSALSANAFAAVTLRRFRPCEVRVLGAVVTNSYQLGAVVTDRVPTCQRIAINVVTATTGMLPHDRRESVFRTVVATERGDVEVNRTARMTTRVTRAMQRARQAVSGAVNTGREE